VCVSKNADLMAFLVQWCVCLSGVLSNCIPVRCSTTKKIEDGITIISVINKYTSK
jgi:hypothetical protein